MPRFLHNFSEYNDGTIVDDGWWQIEDGYITNICGGCQQYEPSDDDEIVESENFSTLDWSCLLKSDSIFGFIDRDGQHYGCEYGDHRLLAEFYLKTDERSLEKSGWVKIYRDYNRRIKYYCEIGLTEQQIATLDHLGILKDRDRI